MLPDLRDRRARHFLRRQGERASPYWMLPCDGSTVSSLRCLHHRWRYCCAAVRDRVAAQFHREASSTACVSRYGPRGSRAAAAQGRVRGRRQCWPFRRRATRLVLIVVCSASRAPAGAPARCAIDGSALAQTRLLRSVANCPHSPTEAACRRARASQVRDKPSRWPPADPSVKLAQLRRTDALTGDHAARLDGEVAEVIGALEALVLGDDRANSAFIPL